MRSFFPVAVAGLLAATAGAGDATAAGDVEAPGWRVGGTAYAYAVPDQPDFVVGVVSADARWAHAEGRYNYEALRTGSAFLGVNGRWGGSVKLGLTPMVGATFGALRAAVPALRLSLTWWKLDLSSESETVIDLGPAAASFFYDWSELGLSPLGWLRFGAAIQRSHVFHTSLDIQRGLFLGVSVGAASLTVYEFNAGWIAPTIVAVLAVAP